MLVLQKQVAPIRGKGHDNCERDHLLSQIEKTDMEIENLVYDLYGLTRDDLPPSFLPIPTLDH